MQMHNLNAVARYVKASGATTTKQIETTVEVREEIPTKTETKKSYAVGIEALVLLFFVVAFACWIMYNVVTFGIPVA